jgi:hypothetical protein
MKMLMRAQTAYDLSKSNKSKCDERIEKKANRLIKRVVKPLIEEKIENGEFICEITVDLDEFKVMLRAADKLRDLGYTVRTRSFYIDCDMTIRWDIPHNFKNFKKTY